MIIAVDPGKRTGLAFYHPEYAVLHNAHFEETATWTAIDRVAFHLSTDEVEVVVCEDFRITPASLKKDLGDMWSLKSIGALVWLCRRHNVPFVLQTPSDAKRVISNTILKRLGWYHGSAGTFEGHADDAARHLALYCLKNSLVELPC